MTRITRDLANAQCKDYDIVVVGGGIYGAMVLLQAAARGLSALLVEKSDFGAATSFNSLRVMHGGLRFLQNLDLRRSQSMIAARAWLLKHFPDLVAPMSCLMPLYNQGLRRTWTLGPALRIDNVLSHQANNGLRVDQRIAPGQLVGANTVQSLFAQVDVNGLKGGAIWQDAQLADSPRLIMETLRWAAALNADALNYVAATQLLAHNKHVNGVRAHDEVTGDVLELHAKVVINATGPESGDFARVSDREAPQMFQPSLAWNVLFHRPALSDHALAVASPSGGQVYFLVPWKGKLLAGTGHTSSNQPPTTHVAHADIVNMVQQINQCIPRLELELSEVAHVFSGLLPVRRAGSVNLATRDAFHDHGQNGGPEGLFSISGVKLVAAQAVAEKTLKRVCERFFPRRQATPLPPRPAPSEYWRMKPGQPVAPQTIKDLADGESVVHLSDLVLRRTSLWSGQLPTQESLGAIGFALGYTEDVLQQEIQRMLGELDTWDTEHG